MADDKKSGTHEALRAAGFVPLPRWWVTRDDLQVVHHIAHKHADKVNDIRRQCREARGEEKTPTEK